VETTIIRKGTKQDLTAVLDLVRELALFEKAPAQVTNTVESMEEDGFGKNPVFSFLVAELNNTIVGISVYFTKYSTWKGKGLYLDDLYVTESHRGKGIGKKLFDATINEAKRINAKQMHWQVLDWNTPAIEFYKKYGVYADAEWLDCKLNQDQLKKL
jgi:GNAT superfamily N-acetyltransferase